MIDYEKELKENYPETYNRSLSTIELLNDRLNKDWFILGILRGIKEGRWFYGDSLNKIQPEMSHKGDILGFVRAITYFETIQGQDHLTVEQIRQHLIKSYALDKQKELKENKVIFA